MHDDAHRLLAQNRELRRYRVALHDAALASLPY